MEYFLSCSCVCIIAWLHHVDFNKTHREKQDRNYTTMLHAVLNRNYTRMLHAVLILETAPHNKAIVQPFNPHLKNHPSKMNKTCGTRLKKQEKLISNVLLWSPYTWMYQYWPTSKNLLASALYGCPVEYTDCFSAEG